MGSGCLELKAVSSGYVRWREEGGGCEGPTIVAEALYVLLRLDEICIRLTNVEWWFCKV